jgi:hypothetical protein
VLATIEEPTGSRPGALFAPGLLRRLALRAGFVVAYYVAAIPAGVFRAVADNIGFPVRHDFAAVEAAILTDTPNLWLQDAFLRFDWLWHASLYVYASWFALPLIATLPIAGARGALPWRLLGFVMLTYYAGMPFFALYPLEPPWLHNPDITRIVHELHPEVVGKDENVYAAMPSLHIALPAAAALWFGLNRGFGKVLLAWTCLIGIGVVYSGDHYVADVAGGAALALASYWFVRALRLPLLSEHALPAEEAPDARLPWREAA